MATLCNSLIYPYLCFIIYRLIETKALFLQHNYFYLKIIQSYIFFFFVKAEIIINFLYSSSHLLSKRKHKEVITRYLKVKHEEKEQNV